jgi:hypothetical protein
VAARKNSGGGLLGVAGDGCDERDTKYVRIMPGKKETTLLYV